MHSQACLTVLGGKTDDESCPSEKYEPVLSIPTLPGHGNAGENCQESLVYFCRRCGHTFLVKRSCMARECPHCYEKWASKEGKMAALRFWMGRRVLTRGGRSKRDRRALHVVVSMPPSDLPLEDLRARARGILKSHGCVGGCMIEHPFRQDEGGRFVLDDHDHFHVFGLFFGDVPPGGNDPGGVVFKIVKDAKRGDYNGFRRMRELRAAIRYVLTHCGVRKGKHSLTWFGEMSYNMLSTACLNEMFPDVLDHAKEYVRRCPRCGSEDVEELEPLDLTVWSQRFRVPRTPPDTLGVVG